MTTNFSYEPKSQNPDQQRKGWNVTPANPIELYTEYIQYLNLLDSPMLTQIHHNLKNDVYSDPKVFNTIIHGLLQDLAE